MTYDALNDTLQYLIDLGNLAARIGEPGVARSAAVLALNVALVELDGYRPSVAS